MRSLTLLAAALWIAAPVAAQAPTKPAKPGAREAGSGMATGKMMKMNMDEDRKVEGGGVFPTGWTARTDRDAPVTGVKFVAMGEGFHATMGPAAIFYREANEVKGRFHAVASFTQEKEPMHPEAYGLFFNGKDLAGPAQHYIYFLVRGDGSYLVKRRDGTTTTDITSGKNGWTANPAVVKPDAEGKATNKLEIDATAAGKIAFKVNGTTVYEMPATDAEYPGVVGLRINHNLDVHIAGFGVHPVS